MLRFGSVQFSQQKRRRQGSVLGVFTIGSVLGALNFKTQKRRRQGSVLGVFAGGSVLKRFVNCY